MALTASLNNGSWPLESNSLPAKTSWEVVDARIGPLDVGVPDAGRAPGEDAVGEPGEGPWDRGAPVGPRPGPPDYR